MFAHDFRRMPVDDWVEVVTERALAQDIAAAPASRNEPMVLSQAAFPMPCDRRCATSDRAERLARNPLCRTRLVTPTRRRTTLPMCCRLVHDAAATLRQHPRDDKRWRAIDRTYLRPAASQERAAEVLGLPFSTYRRHLTEGVSRIVEVLWQRELYGPAGAETDHGSSKDRTVHRTVRASNLVVGGDRP